MYPFMLKMYPSKTSQNSSMGTALGTHLKQCRWTSLDVERLKSQALRGFKSRFGRCETALNMMLFSNTKTAKNLP